MHLPRYLPVSLLGSVLETLPPLILPVVFSEILRDDHVYHRAMIKILPHSCIVIIDNTNLVTAEVAQLAVAVVDAYYRSLAS